MGELIDPKWLEQIVALRATRDFDGLKLFASEIVATARTAEALIAIIEHPYLKPCQDEATEALAARGREEAHFVLSHYGVSSWKARRIAIAQLPAPEVYDTFEALIPSFPARAARNLWFAILETRGAARDERWVDRADPEDSEALNGVAMLIAIGRDPGHPARDRAVMKLVAAMDADDRAPRYDFARFVLDVGKTHSPLAVASLLRLLAKKQFGSLELKALSLCAGVDVIPTLERRLETDPSHAGDCRRAIERIRSRAEREARIAADPVLSELTRAMIAGDLQAAQVLEDALRERGLEEPNDF
jgi:hypothetical protein